MKDLKKGDTVVCFHKTTPFRIGEVVEVHIDSVRVLFQQPPYFEVVEKVYVLHPKTIYEEKLYGIN